MDRRGFFKRFAIGSAALVVIPAIVVSAIKQAHPVKIIAGTDPFRKKGIIVLKARRKGMSWMYDSELEMMKRFMHEQEFQALYGEYKNNGNLIFKKS